MRYGQMRKYDIANGVGIRSTLFVTGCTHHCYNCFNEEYQDFQAGKEWTAEEEGELLSYLRDPRVTGLTVLGGEPFQNTNGLIPLLKKVREEIKKSIWIYSGYTWEEIQEDEKRKELLQLADVLVDGRFVDALKDPMLRFRGSSNQRVINVPASLAAGQIILLWNEEEGRVK